MKLGTFQVKLTKPCGSSWTVKNMEELVNEILAASAGWRELANFSNIEDLFAPAIVQRTSGVFTHPDGSVMFKWRRL